MFAKSYLSNAADYSIFRCKAMEGTRITSTSIGAQGWSAPDDFHDSRVHLIGIGGSGMAGLAAVLLHRGAQISGSDRVRSVSIERLIRRGARVSTGPGAEPIPSEVELVVASAAIADEHAELDEARRRGIPVVKYAGMLGLLMDQREGVGVSGTHGKTTTTAWLTYTLQRAGLDPSFVVGGEAAQLGGNAGVGAGRHFVAEACEYDRSFLNLRPKAAVILNIDQDHFDCYDDFPAILNAFRAFADGVRDDGLLLVNGDDPHCAGIVDGITTRVETFGFDEANTWRASDLRLREGRYEFTIWCDGQRLDRVWLALPGRHNVANALAVAGLANHCGAAWEQIAAALRLFEGVKRRMQLRAELEGVRVVDDYAHHPTEVRATLAAVGERYAPQRLWCVFQPHQHSRLRALLDDFGQSFAGADRVIVSDVFFVRDSPSEAETVSASDLVDRIRENGGEALLISGFEAIVEMLAQEVRRGDLVLTMGAGDIWKVADELVERIRDDLPH